MKAIGFGPQDWGYIGGVRGTVRFIAWQTQQNTCDQSVVTRTRTVSGIHRTTNHQNSPNRQGNVARSFHKQSICIIKPWIQCAQLWSQTAGAQPPVQEN